MSNHQRIIPIYTTRGDTEAYLVYPYIYNRRGEWIGWITHDRQVFSVHGHYVGWLADGPRILRKLAQAYGRAQVNIDSPTSQVISLPASTPLAPMMSELPFGTVDVLEEAPDLMPPIDFGELREDMD